MSSSRTRALTLYSICLTSCYNLFCTFGQLILSNIIKIVATKFHNIIGPKLNAPNFISLGLRSRIRWGSLQRSPGPQLDLWVLHLREKKGRKKGKRKRTGTDKTEKKAEENREGQMGKEQKTGKKELPQFTLNFRTGYVTGTFSHDSDQITSHVSHVK